MNAPLEITLISCAVLGFRHGFDYDHIAAISDITSVQEKDRQACGSAFSTYSAMPQ
jgi:high-affinity nickel-transport protein